jgi:hypothetical protein
MRCLPACSFNPAASCKSLREKAKGRCLLNLSARFRILEIETVKGGRLFSDVREHSGGTIFHCSANLTIYTARISCFLNGEANMKFLNFLRKISRKFGWFGALATSLSWAAIYLDHAWLWVRHFLA